ncbi:MAG: SRPBCC domain-containing protein [Tabrizicola sp.]|nr:SRPBCC domain-containing protein [Tabrizicola sp.]
MSKDQTDSVSRSIVISGSPDRVFRALTEEFGTWFQVRLEGPFRVGDLTKGAMTMHQVAGLPFKARTVALEPPGRFAFDWPQWDFEANRNLEDEAPWTRVEFTLEPVAEGTRVTVTESGFAGFTPSLGARLLRENTEGWEFQLAQLKSHVG